MITGRPLSRHRVIRLKDSTPYTIPYLRARKTIQVGIPITRTQLRSFTPLPPGTNPTFALSAQLKFRYMFLNVEFKLIGSEVPPVHISPCL